MADPVTYVEQRFEQLKSFMRRQPSSWAKTGDPVTDAANRARMDLADTAVKYADSIAEGLKIAAKIYGMTPGHPKITIHFPNTPNDQVDLRQQKRIVELHEEFRAYIREHGIFLSSGNSAPKPSTGAMPQMKQETIATPMSPPPVSADVPACSQVSTTDATNIWTLLSEKSVTTSQAKEKAKIFLRIGLVGLVPSLLALAVMGIELLLTNGVYQYGAYSLFVLFLCAPAVLVGFYMAFTESLSEWACPKCEMLNAKKMISREESNQRKTKERREIKTKDSEGKTISTGKYEDVPVTNYKVTEIYQCPFCEHKWEHRFDRTRDGWDGV